MKLIVILKTLTASEVPWCEARSPVLDAGHSFPHIDLLHLTEDAPRCWKHEPAERAAKTHNSQPIANEASLPLTGAHRAEDSIRPARRRTFTRRRPSRASISHHDRDPRAKEKRVQNHFGAVNCEALRLLRSASIWRKTLEDMERAKGIEPSSVAWEATALPLSYARVARQVYAGHVFKRNGQALAACP